MMGVARVSEREQAGRTVYRVRVGPFQNRDAAERSRRGWTTRIRRRPGARAA
jgi:cell division protein FtsN